MKDETIKLQRNLLGSIDIDDIEEEMTPQERKEYINAIFAVYPRLEKDLKKFMHTQLLFSSNHAENWEQVIFGRGTFNGMALLLEHWKLAVSEFEAQDKDE